ncbi:MAG: divalent metal cation transporter [Patescibacteria group bacterium]|jgi:NRAMP (natural resistance-associated macrophage protein)-like metal ion transporter
MSEEKYVAEVAAQSDGHKHFTISEFRHELGIPLILARKLIVWGIVEVERTADGTFRITEAELNEAREILKHPFTKAKLFFRALGPGIITGAADDDPSGIGTYSSVGAQYGFGLIWLAPWLLPLMTAVQEACARIGIVTNRGLAGVLMKHYRKWFVAIIILLLIVANVANIGADISAMSATVNMLVPVNYYVVAVALTVLIILIEIMIPYRVYSKILKWLTLSLFAYLITGFIIHPDWLMIFKEALTPNVIFDKAYIFAIVAVFGTTISPYLFFWQTSEEVEEKKVERREGTLQKLTGRIAHMRTDVRTGMVFANLTFFFIVLTTAKVLNANGIFSIDSPQQAAEALRPFAGDQAFLLFALGILGTGLLAIPVLAGSGAYALAELMNWREGLDEKFSRAKAFYLVISFSVIVGLLLNFIGINPMKALYYSAYLNGIISIPLLFVIMIVGNDKRIMGRETHPAWVKIFGWAAFAFASAGLVLTIILSLVK